VLKEHHCVDARIKTAWGAHGKNKKKVPVNKIQFFERQPVRRL